MMVIGTVLLRTVEVLELGRYISTALSRCGLTAESSLDFRPDMQPEG